MPFMTVSGLSALLCVILVILLLPLMRRYALARPNARSSHKVPTPQGGGIAVLGATLLVCSTVFYAAYPALLTDAGFVSLAAASILLAIIGTIDDIQPMPAAPRLLAHALSAFIVVLFGLGGFRVLPFMPYWLELGLLTLALTWFINLTNFMDGLDLLVVGAKLPILAALALFSAGNFTPPVHGMVASALSGALLGFAPFNRPVAKLFLGDVGSLPIGLIVGWLLLGLASQGHLVAAVILPLYFCADATITLARRVARRERVWEAHRTHFYQQATTNGFSAVQIALHVVGLNIALAMLAGATVMWPQPATQIAAAAAAGLLLMACLMRFARPAASISS